MSQPVAITSQTRTFFRFREFSVERVQHLAAEFEHAQPFPHLVLENFLNPTPVELDGIFPAPDWPHWNKRKDFYQSGKMYCRDPDVIPPPILSIFHELSSPPFLNFLESVTGIEGIIPDLYYDGGGLH